SLGISMVVAVAMGVGIGLVLKNLTGAAWTLWIGVFIGVAAAILNVYKAYEKQKEGYEELAKEPRYAIKKQLEDEDDEDYGDKSY
ncbi:MAG: AtpZ/AtpI family protein, partial [Thiovulaceae bacterium]|nr:AtpZ/AtpI family protein [Sulfurimonadaceae bacterium]